MGFSLLYTQRFWAVILTQKLYLCNSFVTSIKLFWTHWLRKNTWNDVQVMTLHQSQINTRICWRTMVYRRCESSVPWNVAQNPDKVGSWTAGQAEEVSVIVQASMVSFGNSAPSSGTLITNICTVHSFRNSSLRGSGRYLRGQADSLIGGPSRLRYVSRRKTATDVVKFLSDDLKSRANYSTALKCMQLPYNKA